MSHLGLKVLDLLGQTNPIFLHFRKFQTDVSLFGEIKPVDSLVFGDWDTVFRAVGVSPQDGSTGFSSPMIPREFLLPFFPQSLHGLKTK